MTFNRPFSRRSWLCIGAIALATFATYGSSLKNDFVAWDDPQLVYENPLVSSHSPRIFASYDPELYVPVTMLSFQIEHAIAGFNPFVFHLDALLLHTLNTLLVFALLSLLFKRRWIALGCALLFALHPLNTETVAWVSARKELLSGTFFLLSLIAYMRREDWRRWKFISLGCFVLALLSKVTVAMLPFVLLLIDWQQGRTITRETIKEKWPYFLLAAVAITIGLFGKSDALQILTLWQVILLACSSITFYLQKFFWPVDLSAIYPPPDPIAVGNPVITLSIMAVFALPAILWFVRKKFPGALLGFGFFLLMLAPSFLAFQKADDVMFAADHYAYIPLIGLSIAIGSLLIFLRKKITQTIVTVIAIGILVWLSVITHTQSLLWRDTETLFSHVLQQNPTSHIAYGNLGFQALERGQTGQAIEYLNKALKLKPTYADAYVNLGAAFGKEHDYARAEVALKQGLQINPDHAQGHFNLGGVYQMLGNPNAAITEYERTIKINSAHANAYWQLARMYLKLGKRTEAATAYRSAVDLNPAFRGVSAEMDALENVR